MPQDKLRLFGWRGQQDTKDDEWQDDGGDGRGCSRNDRRRRVKEMKERSKVKKLQICQITPGQEVQWILKKAVHPCPDHTTFRSIVKEKRKDWGTCRKETGAKGQRGKREDMHFLKNSFFFKRVYCWNVQCKLEPLEGTLNSGTHYLLFILFTTHSMFSPMFMNVEISFCHYTSIVN